MYDDILPMFRDIGAEPMHYRRGALTVYESDAAFEADQDEWALKRELGVRWHALKPRHVRELEPALAPVFRHGVYLEDWSHIGDPRRLVTLLREHVCVLGGEFVTGVARAIEAPASVVFADGASVRQTHRGGGGRVVRVAGGIDRRSRAAGERARLQRDAAKAGDRAVARGDLRGAQVRRDAARHRLAHRRRDGIPGLDAPANYRRREALLALGQRFLPGVDETDAVNWMGNRPTTPDSLPVIGASPRVASVIYAFGHGHLGLMQCATTAVLIADVLAQSPRVPLTPYSIARFESGS